MGGIPRRNFLLAAAALLAAPWARAQRGKNARIGVLMFYDETDSVFREPFKAGLRELGYVDGQNVAVEWRVAGGRLDRAAAQAAELAKMNVDIIVATPTQAVEAARNATRTIPIVMAPAGDPVGTGFVSSLSRPGGNITGLTNIAAELSGKLMELIKELRPGAKRVAVLVQTGNPFSKSFLEQFQAGNKSGVAVEAFTASGEAGLDAVFTAMVAKQVSAAVLTPQLATRLAAELSVKHRLPSVTTGIATRTFPQVGGLLSYGPDPIDQYRRAAVYVDKILKGANPAELPVEQPSTFELIVNVRTAKALGLRVPRSILARANRVIQ